MPTLTYWVARIKDDHSCYNIRAKTKKAVLADLDLHKIGNSLSHYDAPKKVSVYYENAFDLMLQCIDGEGFGGYWE